MLRCRMKCTLLLFLGMIVAIRADARPHVATLNAQAAIRATHDGEAAAAELKRKFGAGEARLSEQEREIRDLQRQVEASGAGPLRDRLDALTVRHRHDTQELQRMVDEEQRRMLQELNKKLLAVVEQYARKKHFEVVLDESDPGMPLYWHSAATDITAEVVKRYDQAAARRPRH